MSTVGENIKRIRKEKGLTQKELAQKCGILYQTLGKYERGLLNPKIDTIKKIANALEVEGLELISLDAAEGLFVEGIFDVIEEVTKDEEVKYYRELNKREILFIYELIGEYFKRYEKYPVNLNDTNGLNIFMDKKLREYKTLSNEELKAIENDVLNYLDFLLDKALKEKEIKKTNS